MKINHRKFQKMAKAFIKKNSAGRDTDPYPKSKMASDLTVAKLLPTATTLRTSQRFVALDVECVATGLGHNARSPCSVSIVGSDESIMLQLMIRSSLPVVSYLTPVTGFTAADFTESAVSENDAISQVKALLGPDTILVGQAILSDIIWLKLQKGVIL